MLAAACMPSARQALGAGLLGEGTGGGTWEVDAAGREGRVCSWDEGEDSMGVDILAVGEIEGGSGAVRPI